MCTCDCKVSLWSPEAALGSGASQDPQGMPPLSLWPRAASSPQHPGSHPRTDLQCAGRTHADQTRSECFLLRKPGTFLRKTKAEQDFVKQVPNKTAELVLGEPGGFGAEPVGGRQLPRQAQALS